MPFTPESPIVAVTRTPTTIGPMVVQFTTKDALSVGPDIGTVSFEILDQNGAVMRAPNVNLLPQLTAGQLTTITTFLTNLRTKINAEVLA